MRTKKTGGTLNPEAVKSLKLAKQHFLTANREDILALNDIIEFIKHVVEGYNDVPAAASLVSLLTMMQLILNVIIKKIIDPLRMGEMPADAGEIVYMINGMVDDELSKLEKGDPSDPRIQVLWGIKEILSGKKRYKSGKKVKRIKVE